ncbi:MAG TPA: hypothetical protein VFM18_11800 [Methanosarcina sp.]|nr:hypothetical protein [Methanosarcina sp.]
MSRKYKTKTNYAYIGDFRFNKDHFESNQEQQSNGCIHWTGGKHRQGYGMIAIYNTQSETDHMTVIHRIVAMLKYKRNLVKGEQVIHTCSNQICMNPDHIIIGTIKDRSENAKQNGVYANRKKRGPSKTKQNREYKFTDEELRYIITETNIDKICEKFDMNRERVLRWRWEIRKGYRWLNKAEDK